MLRILQFRRHVATDRVPRCLPAAVGTGLAVAACAGPQSWGSPAGAEAASIAELFWIMAGGAAVIWTLVVATMVFASFSAPTRRSRARRTVIWGGMVAPTVVIFALLIAGLQLIRDVTGRTAHLSIDAKGEQWWWRLAYVGPGGTKVPVANELRLPRGETAELVLRSDDVIHSLWVPSLGGKMDMIPGRVNRLLLTPTRTGTFRGACAEFCGEAHAQMSLPVMVMEPAAYRRWVADQAQPASAPDSARARRGLELFLATGCDACHAIRGTPADGTLAPDLTHLGSRLSIGAGLLPMNRDNLVRWIANSERLKPGVRMPAFDMLPEDELLLIADYLASLK